MIIMIIAIMIMIITSSSPQARDHDYDHYIFITHLRLDKLLINNMSREVKATAHSKQDHWHLQRVSLALRIREEQQYSFNIPSIFLPSSASKPAIENWRRATIFLRKHSHGSKREDTPWLQTSLLPSWTECELLVNIRTRLSQHPENRDISSIAMC